MGISPFQLLVVLLIVAMIFGTKKLRGLGEDLGAAVKGFKDGVSSEKPEAITQQENKPVEQNSTKQHENV